MALSATVFGSPRAATMRVYEFAPRDGYEMVMPEDAGVFDVVKRLDGSVRSTSWVPAKIRLVPFDDRGRRLVESDFPWLSGNAPVLRQHAVDGLWQLLVKEVELLPLSTDKGSLWLLNVTNVVDALDVERSDYAVFPNTSRVMHVRRYAFIADRLRNVGFFRVPQLLTYAVYVTQGIVDAVEHSGLRGPHFRTIWED